MWGGGSEDGTELALFFSSAKLFYITDIIAQCCLFVYTIDNEIIICEGLCYKL